MWQVPHRSLTRSKRGAWAAVGVCLGAALSVAGCQDGYPLETTRCDRWCDLTQEIQCGEYRPAACVVACEGQASSVAECYPEFDALLTCLEVHRAEIHGIVFNCSGGIGTSNPACMDQENAVTDCAVEHARHFWDPSAVGGSGVK